MASAIELRDLVKAFDRRVERGMFAALRGRRKQQVVAVDGVSLDVAEGELFGLLGPNAAGKTTLVKLMATLLAPTSGQARVLGFDTVDEADEVRRRIGVVLGGERALYWRLTARENLWYFSQLYDIPDREANRRIDDLLRTVGLEDRADDRVETYSKGMKQRLHVARGLLNEPSVLLLDEPTIGLDPHAARSLRALLRDVVERRGVTIVLTTHYMYEADELSDRVAILSRGRIVACDAPARLKAKHAAGAAYRVGVSGGAASLRDALAKARGVAAVVSEATDPATGVATYRLASDGDAEALPGAVARAVEDARARLVSLTREEATLEDVFVSLTGESLSGEEREGPD